MKSTRFCQNIKLSRHTSASSAAHSLENTRLEGEGRASFCVKVSNGG